MFRAAAAFMLLAVTAWLMPLGAFIRPSQEKTACGGHRAFHMCSMMDGDSTVKPDGIGTPNFHPVKSPGSGGDDFLAPDEAFRAGETPSFLASDPQASALSHISEIPAPPPEAAV